MSKAPKRCPCDSGLDFTDCHGERWLRNHRIGPTSERELADAIHEAERVFRQKQSAARFPGVSQVAQTSGPAFNKARMDERPKAPSPNEIARFAEERKQRVAEALINIAGIQAEIEELEQRQALYVQLARAGGVAWRVIAEAAKTSTMTAMRRWGKDDQGDADS